MLYRPAEELAVTNQTQGKTLTLPGWTFESEVKGGEIFVFCLSRSLNGALRDKFGAVACVEIRAFKIFLCKDCQSITISCDIS